MTVECGVRDGSGRCGQRQLSLTLQTRQIYDVDGPFIGCTERGTA